MKETVPAGPSLARPPFRRALRLQGAVITGSVACATQGQFPV